MRVAAKPSRYVSPRKMGCQAHTDAVDAWRMLLSATPAADTGPPQRTLDLAVQTGHGGWQSTVRATNRGTRPSSSHAANDPPHQENFLPADSHLPQAPETSRDAPWPVIRALIRFHDHSLSPAPAKTACMPPCNLYRWNHSQKFNALPVWLRRRSSYIQLAWQSRLANTASLLSA